MDKKYTVKEFCKKYNEIKSTPAKATFIESLINVSYVPLEEKVTICEKIIKSSYYKETERNGLKVKKLHVYSPAQYMLYHLYIISKYTNISIDFKNSLEEFNMLNKHDLFDVFLDLVPEKELKEFRMILEMTENDLLQNEYETHAFISNQVERFGQLFGSIAKPAIDRLRETVSGINSKNIDEIVEKITGLKDRILK